MSSITPPAQLIDALRTAANVVVMTGAGISAESGVPTFREAQTGLWAQYDPEELATPRAFQRNPELVWEWYRWRRELTAQAQPNPGHLALAKLADLVPNFTLITQNVDGLHQRAGSAELIELHGNLQRIKCSGDGRIILGWPPTEQVPPPCPHCGALLRPDVVWFGESLPAIALNRAAQAAEQADLYLSVGTSAVVHPAAALAHIALQRQAVVVEINLDPTPLTPHATIAWHGRSGELLPALLQAAFPDAPR